MASSRHKQYVIDLEKATRILVEGNDKLKHDVSTLTYQINDSNLKIDRLKRELVASSKDGRDILAMPPTDTALDPRTNTPDTPRENVPVAL